KGRVVYRMIRREACCLDDLSGPHPVKLNPGVLPGEFCIGNIGIDLVGKDHKSLTAVNLIFPRLSFGVVGDQLPGSGYDIVEEIVISCRGTERVSRLTLLLPKLIQSQIYKIFVWKYRKEMIAH